MIDVAALRSLIAVAEHGSVVEAARTLGFTPSAVSQQIRRLEGGGRRPMLERVGRGVVLTEPARLLVERGSGLLGSLDALEQLVHSGDEVITGTYRLATFATASRGLVAPLLARLEERAPRLRVEVVEHDPWETVAAVARGRVEAGLVHDWTTMPLELPDDVEGAAVLVDRADVLLRRDHPLAARARVDPRDLAGERWMTMGPGTVCHDWLLQMHAVHRMRPDLRHVASDFATHVAMVDAGVAVALVPRLGRTVLPPGVVAVEVEDPVPQRTVQLIWRRSAAGSPIRVLVHRELAAVVATIDGRSEHA